MRRRLSLALSFYILFFAGFSAVTQAQQEVLVTVAAIPRKIAEPVIYMLLHEALALNSTWAIIATFGTEDLGISLGLVHQTFSNLGFTSVRH